MDKKKFFEDLSRERNGGVPVDPAVIAERRRGLKEAWAADGLTLADRVGKWGQSFDAQRLISFARKQGRNREVRRTVGGRPRQEWLSKTATVRCTLG